MKKKEGSSENGEAPKGSRLKRNALKKSFNPLGRLNPQEAERLIKNNLQNIIDSYQGKYDLFIEMIQNAVDAVEMRAKQGGERDYVPQVWIVVNLKDEQISVVDNGTGISKEEVMKMLTPHLTFKDGLAASGMRLRGHKGVGATYLAYGFNYIRVSTRGADGFFSYELCGGRRWVDGASSEMPLAHPAEEVLPEFDRLLRGTAVTVGVGEGTRPISLARIGSSWERWALVLRTRTAVGLVDLAGREKWAKGAKVRLTLIDARGERKEGEVPLSLLFPHDIEGFEFLDLREYEKSKGGMEPKLKSTGKDALFYRLKASELKKRGLVDRASCLLGQKVIVYAFFSHSASLFESLEKAELKEKSGSRRQRLIGPGVWVASSHAVVGNSISLELAYGAGNEDRLFMLAELEEVRPDLGRKGFSPELEEEIRQLGDRIIKYFLGYRSLLKPAGIQPNQAAQKQELFIRVQEAQKRKGEEPLKGGYSLAVIPQNEPEVIALFQEMLGRGELLGYQIMGIFHGATYDGVFSYRLDKHLPGAILHPENNPLGVPEAAFRNKRKKESGAIVFPPSLYEYKVSLDNLVEEFERQDSPKQFEQVELVVVWELGKRWKRSYDLIDLVEDGKLNHRELFGATHLLCRKGMSTGHVIKVICLKRVVDALYK
jgi:hypothetical protein